MGFLVGAKDFKRFSNGSYRPLTSPGDFKRFSDRWSRMGFLVGAKDFKRFSL
jgi:hypothetical protein